MGCWGGSSEGLAVGFFVFFFFSWDDQQVSGYDLLLLFQLTVQLVPAYRMAGGHALLNSNPMLLFTDVQNSFSFSYFLLDRWFCYVALFCEKQRQMVFLKKHNLP